MHVGGERSFRVLRHGTLRKKKCFWYLVNNLVIYAHRRGGVISSAANAARVPAPPLPYYASSYLGSQGVLDSGSGWGVLHET